jgi:hypothetical protein
MAIPPNSLKEVNLNDAVDDHTLGLLFDRQQGLEKLSVPVSRDLRILVICRRSRSR